MAPALTEPLSPTENLTKSAVTAPTTPTTRSTRKLESSIGNKSGINTNNTIREKRNRTGGSISVNQTPTSSKRITRSKDNQQRSTAVTPTSTSLSPKGDNTEQNSNTTTTNAKRISTKVIESVQKIDTYTNNNSNSNNNKNNPSTKNEQMGLSTAPLNNNNNNNNNNNINSTSVENLVEIKDSTKDTSTAQLLADLTNEAITAEICLRNQLKDVNLVKTSVGDPSSPIIQQEDTFVDTDILVLKAVGSSPTIVAEPVINKTTSAHMEAQLIDKSTTKSTTTTKVQETNTTTTTTTVEASATSDIEAKPSTQVVTATGTTKPAENVTEDNNHKALEEKAKFKDGPVTEVSTTQENDNENEHKQEKSLDAVATTENYLETACDTAVHETPIGSPNSCEDGGVGTEESKKSDSKLEILSMQELPPVSTDSTMTASEVEDNLEERLSQLDGTAIDSPPPNNHELDSNEKICENSVTNATPPRTPTHQQNLTNDLQELQQQLQHTPPTPVAQQVQQIQLQLQQHLPQQQQSPHPLPQQTNCFNTPQSTTSSMNSLGTFNNMTPQTYIKETENVSATAELEDQDIEEVFKVLKGFEGGNTSDINVCDLNVLFNEVYMKMNETELSSNAGSGGGSIVSGAISTNTQSHIAVTNPSIQLVKPTQMEEGQLEIEKRQQQMQRKTDFLMRRLRKLQARYMCKHTSEEIAGLFEWSARQSSKGLTNATTLQPNETAGAVDPNKCFLKVIAARPPASDWKDVNESLVPANQISTLLRKIESVANAQQLCTTPTASLVNISHKKTKKALLEAQTASNPSNSASKSSHFSEAKAEEVVVATLEENVTDELSQVAGLLQTEMSEVQKAIDSDATESSSGGESADEMVAYNNTQQQSLPITKRAAWRYSRDRAAIASRWSWLLSQIADLEIKIRQHSELHQEIVRSKGQVTCDNTTAATTTTKTGSVEDNEEDMGSCRTRGFVPALFRKRKLIQTTNIHTISKKAARPSTIKCGCQWPLHPCALCTGRLDPTAPRDLPDTMMMSDRIALLDSGYHPVLSFRENVNNALHFEAIAKQPEWQQRVMRCQAKNIAKNVWRAEREAVAAAAGGHHSTSTKKYSDAPPAKRRYIKKKDRLNNDEKTGGKSSHSTASATASAAGIHAATILTSTATAASTSLNDVGNGTANLSTSTTTTSTTPLVANKGTIKSAKKQHCPVMRNESVINSLLPPTCLTTASTTTIISNRYIHQTSDCLPIKYDQYNPNPIPSSLISNINSSSKSNKNRKLSSSITAVNSHHYNNHLLNNTNSSSNSNLFNGDTYSHEIWGGGGGGGAGENFNVRSRTSSPTHGSSGNNYHKYERSLDRKNRTSYDIDNIVIPYSVAAATRVEILPYKEIPTPKWRVIENDNDENNKLKTNVEASEDCKPLTNGHLNEDNKLLETIKNETENKNENSETNVKKFKDTECKDENIKENTSSSLDNKSSSSVKTEKNEANDIKLKSAIVDEIPKDNNDNKGGIITSVKDDGDVVDESTKEPELKKPKIEPCVIEADNKDTEKGKIGSTTAISTEKNVKEEEEKIALQNCSKVVVGTTEEEEDISDDAMFLRHERALTEERRKFQTYLKFPWSTRSRANRRIDSRAESSGANTPDPSSPAPQTPSVGGGDLESIPSPLNPATPLNPLDTMSEAGDNSTSFLGVGPLPSLSSKRYERRRTTSTKRDRELERRSSTPDSKELIPPYEPLTFPLTDEQFEELLRAMPSDHGEDSKRFDECYLPGGGGTMLNNKNPRTISGSTSKRPSRASTVCGDNTTTTSSTRRTKSSSSKNLRPISADDCIENGGGSVDMLMYDEDYDDDYEKHHLAPNDDHLTADSIGVGHVTASGGHYDDEDDVDIYGDQYGAYVGRQQHKTHHQRDSDAESSEEEPFQDDDPNDPEWRGETEERLRKKI